MGTLFVHQVYYSEPQVCGKTLLLGSAAAPAINWRICNSDHDSHECVPDTYNSQVALLAACSLVPRPSLVIDLPAFACNIKNWEIKRGSGDKASLHV